LGFDQLLPADNVTARTAQRIEAVFPGAPAPAQIVFKTDDITSAEATGALDGFKERALASGHVKNPVEVTVHADEHIAVISAPLAGERPRPRRRCSAAPASGRGRWPGSGRGG